MDWLELVRLGGGVSGYVSIASLAYLLWKRRRIEFSVIPSYGKYRAKKTEADHFYDLEIDVDVAYINNGEEKVSLTGVLGTLRYNEERLNRILNQFVDRPKIDRAISSEPSSRDKHNFIVIHPHETIVEKLSFQFPNVILDLIDRGRLVDLIGYWSSGTPILFSSEAEYIEKWSSHPLDFLLSVHINSKKLIHTNVGVFDESLYKIPEISSIGTLLKDQIERDFYMKKNRLSPNLI